MMNCFQGWRRKIGALTLVIALTLMVGWVRSRDRIDTIDFHGKSFRYGINSVDGRIRLLKTTPLEIPPGIYWSSFAASTTHGWGLNDNGHRNPFDPMKDFHIEWRRDWAGFHIGAYSSLRNAAAFRSESFMLPYWSIVIPLTLISAYLMIKQPRKRDELSTSST